MIYWLVPRLWRTQLHSQSLANVHFWAAMLGILFYVVSMWIAGITQGLMWKQFTSEGVLAYPNFTEIVTKQIPFYWLRAVGGAMYVGGLLVMVYNVWRTIKASSPPMDEEAMVSDNAHQQEADPALGRYWHA